MPCVRGCNCVRWGKQRRGRQRLKQQRRPIIIIKGVCKTCDNIKAYRHRAVVSEISAEVLLEREPFICSNGFPVTIKYQGDEFDITKYKTTYGISLDYDDCIPKFLTSIKKCWLINEIQSFVVIDSHWNNGSYIYKIMKRIALGISIGDFNDC